MSQLLQERETLKQDLKVKAGEIAIVRSKQDKVAKEYERELAAIQKLNEEKLAKQQRALEAARIAQQQAATEREFLKQDLAEEAERIRRHKVREAARKKDNAVLSTPGKKKSLPHRDGFDDDEMQIVSPSKVSPSKLNKKSGTPTRMGKRKRKAIDSPIAPLELIQTEESYPDKSKEKASVLDEAMIAKLGIQDDRFDVILMPSDVWITPANSTSFSEQCWIIGPNVISCEPLRSSVNTLSNRPLQSPLNRLYLEAFRP